MQVHIIKLFCVIKCVCTWNAPNEKDAMMSGSLAGKEVGSAGTVDTKPLFLAFTGADLHWQYN